jgi:hypothetical protein
MATFQSNIAAAQVAGANFPGGSGGLTTQPGGFNDPVLELGSSSVITALYTMTGNEAVNDIIQIALMGQGAVISPDSTVVGNGIATTATISVGDTDTVGGTVTADASRYSGSVSVSANTTTTAISFTGGTVLNAPASITDDPVWIQAKILTLNTPVAGKTLCFRLRLTDNR